MSDPEHLLIQPDLPAHEDALDFEPYVLALARLVGGPNTQTPLTVGIFGDWGAGKTSLMRMLQEHLTSQAAPKTTSVWFNAWLYSRQEALWRALLARVISGVRQFLRHHPEAQLELDRIEANLYQPTFAEEGQITLRAEPFANGDATVPLLTGLRLLRNQLPVDKGEALEELILNVERTQGEIARERIASLDAFRATFERLVREYVVPNGRLVIFVDDLDRCLPDQAIDILEAVKLFLDVEGCVFVIAMDREIVRRGIRLKYRDVLQSVGPLDHGFLPDGERYLEKFIQVPFELPVAHHTKLRDYLRNLAPAMPDERCHHVFAAGLPPNPRRIKRAVNTFTLLWQLAQARGITNHISPVRLTKLVAIQQQHPDLYRLLRGQPGLLIDLEQALRRHVHSQAARAGESERELPSSETLASLGALADYAARPELRQLLTMHALTEPDANFADLSRNQIRLYFTLARSVGSLAVQPAPARAIIEPQTILIPAGPFKMGTRVEDGTRLLSEARTYYRDFKREWIEREMPQHEISLPAFEICRYPITNAEYAAFIAAHADYPAPSHWGGMREPPDELGDHPVVNVTWFDAMAYCRWLSKETGRTYTLPTEAQWEKASRGPDGRLYPWGDEFDEKRCNTGLGGPGKTTPVGLYSPHGDTPYGCSDMAGNVWEWCHTPYAPYPYLAEREDGASPDTPRVVRGGSCLNLPVNARCAYRYWGAPASASAFVGFRCVREVPR